MGELKTEAPKKSFGSAKTVKKDCSINVGEIYHLIKGDKLPEGIEKKFFASLESDGVI